MSADQCPECGLKRSSVAGYNHTAWCSHATTADWSERVLKNGKKQRERKKRNRSKDGES